MNLTNLNLSYSEKKTFVLHIIYSFIEGVVLGVLALNEFVMIKSLKGSNIQVSFIFQTSVIVLLLSLIFNELFRRTHRKKYLLRLVAILTRLPIILLFFFPKNPDAYTNSWFYQYYFLFAFLLFYLANPIFFPAINLFLKKNYQHHHFGKLYGYATMLNKIVMLVITFLVGVLLDLNHYAFCYIYPFVAILAIADIYILTAIPFTDEEYKPQTKNFVVALKDSFVYMKDILRKNIPYRDFENGFMLYGFAWMLTFTVITIFFERVLHLNYTNLAFYKNVFNIVAILVLPFFGKLLGRIDPRLFGIYTFISMLLYIVLLMLTEYFPVYFEVLGIKIYYTLAVAYFFYGIFTAMMALLWNIGSAYFCKPSDSDVYQAIHLSLTGVRGVYAPILSVVLLELFNFTIVFLFGIGALLLAIRIMVISMKKFRLEKTTN